MFCKSASQLLKELAYNENDQLTPFNNDMFDQVFRECDEHHMPSSVLNEDDGLDMQTTRNSDHFGAVIHHVSLMRNKRCLMGYMYNRAEIIRSLRWKIGTILPEEIRSKLNYSEEEYFKNHCAALEDMIPPKDPSIQVRVLCDIGDVLLGDQVASLTKNSVHLMKRTDAEQFISQGMMEEFT